VIRQAISCDICGRDKQQTNHWFVVYEHGAELRISGWNSQARTSTKAKHLCGQTCLHKLVDEFMARTIASRPGASGDETASVEGKPLTVEARTDASLTSPAAHLPAASVIAQVPAFREDESQPSARIVADIQSEGLRKEVPLLARPAYNARTWRTEAWRREQEREKRTARSTASQRRSIA